MQTFYILTVFFMLSGEPYAETKITDSLDACREAGITITRTLMMEDTVSAPQVICNRARVQDEGA